MKRKPGKYILTGFLMMIAFVAISQEKHKTEANSLIVEYTNRDGLPTTNISNVAQTKDGLIWISGMEGTYRFNGYEFEEAGVEAGLPKMQDMYYDTLNDVLYFASPQKFIRIKGNDIEVFTPEEGYKINGLAGQMISFINADSKGRIWVGSVTPWVDRKFNGGLTKFENGEFTAYDSTQFPLDNANGFIETPYGDLIFSSRGRNTQTGEGSYVALFKDGSFQRIDESVGIDLQNAIIFNETRLEAIDKNGNTWLAFSGIGNTGNNFTTNSGVLMYDGNKFHQFDELNSILGNNRIPVQVYYCRPLDKLFLATFQNEPEIFNGRNQVIYEFNDGIWEHSDILSEIYPVKDLKTGKTLNDILIAGAFFLPASKFFPELLLMPNTRDINQSPIHPDQMFSLIDGKWQKFDAFEGNNGYEINDGMVFTTPSGIGFYYPNFSRIITEEDGLLMNQSFIVSLFTDMNGLVWISYSYSDIPAYARTYDIGMNVWDGEKIRKLTEEDGLAGNITFRAFQDSRQRIWIPTSKGITMVREITNSIGEEILKLNNIPDQEGKPYNTTSFLETADGEIYSWQNYVRPAGQNLIAADFYLAKLDRERLVRIESPFSDEDNATKYQMYDMREDNEGRLWFFGIFSDNLTDLTSAPTKIRIYDGAKWSDPPDSWNVPREQLHYVGNLKSGMYFLTVGDFYVFNGKQFISLGDSTNGNADFRILKGASVTGTKTDIQVGDKLYIRLRNRGLVIFDGTHLDFYTKKEGLPSANISNPIIDEFRGNVYFSSPAGAVKIHGNTFQTFYNDESRIIGGPSNTIMDGFGNMLEFYDPVGLYINKLIETNYPLIISSVTIEDSLLYFGFPRELSYSQNSLVFNYAALNYKEPKQTNYEHFLEGYDKDWSRPSSITFAEYQNLPFGKYTFRVRGITSNGVKTNEASYSFVIHPPFWRTWWAYVIYGVIFILGVFAVDRIQRKRLLAKERRLIAEKELLHAKEIEKAYTELKSTQKQLIHAEKMASLGELMAGIAHEIQNPLNFVNNFSEVSNELIHEMEEEMDKGDIIGAKAISNDVKRNLDKINYHGKRADAIVKGMLQHSNKHNGKKEPTDINALTDEYLRLSYHGLKARDDNFDVTINRDFDRSLQKIEVIPQDIGRVLLNLINNAFYAVDLKKKKLASDLSALSNLTGQNNYDPTVSVSTRMSDGNVVISVNDNGNGIPDEIKDKIFQPFFTTKPTGEGTGLGLSLSYDIIKAHGGELKVKTETGLGTAFIITLPI
jgi:signal transduction histidine kinase